jgi:hypothetical protein
MFEVIYLFVIIPCSATLDNRAKAQRPVAFIGSSRCNRAPGALVKFGPGREVNIREPEAAAVAMRAVFLAEAA